MTVEQIVNLIEACKTSGVQKLKFEKLEIILHPPAIVPIPAARQIFRDVETQDPMDEDLEDLRIQSLLIDDPLSYEDIKRKMSHAANTRRA